MPTSISVILSYNGGVITFRTLKLDGVTTVLTGKMKPDEVVEETFVNNLSIITSGPLPPNPSELLNSKRMSALLDWARLSE